MGSLLWLILLGGLTGGTVKSELRTVGGKAKKRKAQEFKSPKAQEPKSPRDKNKR